LVGQWGPTTWRSRNSALVALAASVALSACAPGTPLGRASQGDIAACVYVQNAEPSLHLRLGSYENQGPDIASEVTDGVLRGLLAHAWAKIDGPHREAVLDRCRELRALR